MFEWVRDSRFIPAALGTLFGLFLLWFVLNRIPLARLAELMGSVNVLVLAAAVATYLISMLVRAYRWHRLLACKRPIGRTPVLKALFAGFAANNVVPGRLGELVRADYAKRVTALSRSEVLGTIVVERLADGLVVSATLLVGITGFSLSVISPTGAYHVLLVTSITGLTAFAGAALALIFFVRRDIFSELLTNAKLQRIEADFRAGLSNLGKAGLVGIGAASALIWLCEGAALWMVFCAFHQQMGFMEAMVTLGATSLSTLIPTAPGYLGTYQLAFLLVGSVFHFDEAVAQAAALSTQVFLFGTVTLIGGLTFVIGRHTYK